MHLQGFSRIGNSLTVVDHIAVIQELFRRHGRVQKPVTELRGVLRQDRPAGGPVHAEPDGVLRGPYHVVDVDAVLFKLILQCGQSGLVVDVARITDRERRTCIGCVEQHFSRVPGTVLEQITLGDPKITAEMARNAAKLAGIDEAIQALPEGCDTVCSDGMFSQGEWQLLSIARAAAADPAVLLLDEVTANLDAETEARVLEALRRASAGRTVLSVSHRIYENLGGRTVKIEPQSM